MKVTDENGYPLNPASIFIGVQRINIPTENQLIRAVLDGSQLIIPYKFLGHWETLVGVVTELISFPDGIVARFPQNITLSPLKWPEAVLWIPSKGSCGILS